MGHGNQYYISNNQAGQEVFKSIMRSFYKNTAAAFIVYNIAK